MPQPYLLQRVMAKAIVDGNLPFLKTLVLGRIEANTMLQGVTLLMLATQLGDVEIVKFLLFRKANRSKKGSKSKETAYDIAVRLDNKLLIPLLKFKSDGGKVPKKTDSKNDEVF